MSLTIALLNATNIPFVHICPPEVNMVKQKNHTARNQTYKAHRNGIKRPKTQRFRSTKGMDPKFVRNQRWAKRNNRKGQKAADKAAGKN